MLQLQQFFGSFVYKQFDRVLVAKPVAPGNGVVGVFIEAIVRRDSARGTTLRRNRVAPHRIDFRNHGNAEFGIEFRYSDRCAETGTATANQKNIVRRDVHYHPDKRLWMRTSTEAVENLQDDHRSVKEPRDNTPFARRVCHSVFGRDKIVAITWSRFIRAIHSIDISFGQAVSHSPVFVQAPNISSSMAVTMFSTRS